MKALERVLIVDDQVASRNYLSEILGDKYHLLMAASGEEALNKVGDFKPGIILLDVVMGGIDGYEVCQQLRKRDDTQDVKIIFITAKNSLAQKLKGYKAGGDDYLTKPFEELELLAKLQVYAKFESKIQPQEKSDESLDENSQGICYEIKRKLRYITHIKADSPYCNVYYTKDKGGFFRVRISIKNLESFFEGTNLIRVHRSYLVNTKYISNISTVLHQSSSDGQILVFENEVKPIIIPIGKSYQDRLKQKIPSMISF